MHIGKVLTNAVKSQPDKTALVIDGSPLTYRDLEDRSNGLARALAGLGVAPGDRVTLYGPNSWQWIVAYYAIAKVGAVSNPINVMLTPEEVAYVLRDCGAKALVASADKGRPVLDAAPPVAHTLLWGGSPGHGALELEALIDDHAGPFEVVDRAADDIATIGYTSGTTGHPKGAVITHRSVVQNSTLTAQVHGREEGDTVVTALPCAHVYGNVVMNGAFLTGMTLVLFSRFDPAAAL